MPELSFSEFYIELKQVMDHPRAWAHIRYGDGEGIVLGYPEFISRKKAESRWIKWLGHAAIDLKEFALKIRESIKYADIVGLPCQRHQSVNQDWRNVKKFIVSDYKLLSSGRKVCCMDWTVDLQRRNLFKNLLQDKRELYYISCRDVGHELKEKFNIKQIFGFHLPLQHNPKKGIVLTTEQHYPTIYNKIISYIKTSNIEGKIFLVGAGGLGKIYCMEIKKAGGVALDVGSLFDGWKGLVTRSYLKDGYDYSINT